MNRKEALKRLRSLLQLQLFNLESQRDRERDRQRDEVLGVSNNLGVYFLFCLFGLAILALFLCHKRLPN